MILLRRTLAWVLVLGVQITVGTAQTNIQTNTWNCATAGGGCIGHVQVKPDAGQFSPTGFALLRYRSNNVLVAESSLPASSTMQSGRVFVDVAGTVTSGIAFANPNSVDVVVAFYFTDANGNNIGSNSLTLPANQQVSGFFNEAPFNGPATMLGTFTFSASAPISAVAIRGVTNQRSEFLMGNVPISPVSNLSTKAIVVVPHLVNASNWYPQMVLVNPTDVTINGKLDFFGVGAASAQAVKVQVNGQPKTSFNYSIRPRSSTRLSITRQADRIGLGSIRISPASGNSAPFGFAILSYVANGLTVSATTVPAISTSQTARIYAQSAGVWGDIGSIQTALTIANPNSTAVSVQLVLTELDGSLTGLSTSINIPAGAHVAQSMNQLFPTLPNPFRGIVRVSTPSSVTVAGMRATYNERTELLIASVSSLDTIGQINSALEFPHVLNGQGYSTQLILINPFQTKATGQLHFRSSAGALLSQSILAQ